MDALADFSLLAVHDSASGYEGNSHQPTSSSQALKHTSTESQENEKALLHNISYVIQKSLAGFEDRISRRLANQHNLARDPNAHNKKEHYQIMCDNCDSPIVGIRFKCGMCLDYDLCEECEPLRPHLPRSHVFLKIYDPLKNPLGKRKLLPESLEFPTLHVESEQEREVAKITAATQTELSSSLDFEIIGDDELPKCFILSSGRSSPEAQPLLPGLNEETDDTEATSISTESVNEGSESCGDAVEVCSDAGHSSSDDVLSCTSETTTSASLIDIGPSSEMQMNSGAVQSSEPEQAAGSDAQANDGSPINHERLLVDLNSGGHSAAINRLNSTSQEQKQQSEKTLRVESDNQSSELQQQQRPTEEREGDACGESHFSASESNTNGILPHGDVSQASMHQYPWMHQQHMYQKQQWLPHQQQYWMPKQQQQWMPQQQQQWMPQQQQQWMPQQQQQWMPQQQQQWMPQQQQQWMPGQHQAKPQERWVVSQNQLSSQASNQNQPQQAGIEALSEREKLDKLLEMGFYRRDVNLATLRSVNGDFVMTLDKLSALY